MALEDHFDHVIEVWRPIETRGAHAEVDVGWEQVTTPSGVNGCHIPTDGRLEDPGPGERATGRLYWVLHKNATVSERDVLNVTDGDQAPFRGRVVSPPVYPRAHHWEVVVEPSNVLLPGDPGYEES